MPPTTNHVAPPASLTPADPAWAGWDRAYTRALPRLTGRRDLTAVVAPGAGAGAPACYHPDHRRIEINAVHIGTHPDVTDPRRATHKQQAPTGYGLLVHEAAHAAHTRWRIPDHTPPLVAAAARLLEESRAEAHQRTRRRGDRRWLRHTAATLINRDTAPTDDLWHAAQIAGLLLARVDARILTHRDVVTIRGAVATILGRSRLHQLRELWRAAQATGDDDTDTMLALARRWCTTLGIDPDRQPQPPAPDAGVFAGLLADAIDDWLDHTTVASLSGGGSRGVDRVGRLSRQHPIPAAWTSRPPRPDEHAAARRLATQLATAHSQPEPATHPSATPPGRLRTRHAITRRAQIATGSLPTATPWQHRHTMPPPRPRLHLAILVDISGSMTSYAAPLSSAAWILAHAAHTHHATITTIAFGPSVTLLTPPRHRPRQVHEIRPAGGTDTFPDAIKLADQLLQLRNPHTSRLLAVVSDGHLADPAAAQQLLTTLHRSGCRVLWLAPTGISATPFTHTTTIDVADPVDAIAHISQAALDALAAPTGRRR
jgi:hypothetical protein